MKPKMHMVLPDCQVRPGVPINHLEAIGNYAAEKRPDKIVCLGDFADMPSLSSYDIGKASAEGKRYAADLDATKQAMSALLRPIRKLHRHKRPELHLTLGNHEDRIDREAQVNPKWQGFLSTKDLGYEQAGWRVYPFLDVVSLDDLDYSHYFQSGPMGRPVGSASALLRKRHRSSIMGHVQKVDIAIHEESQHIALFAGICYQQDESYLGPKRNGANDCKRGIWMLHEIHDGTFDPMFVSLNFLLRRYL